MNAFVILGQRTEVWKYAAKLIPFKSLGVELEQL